MSRHILVGVAWPYANGPLHLGHIGGAYLPADIFAHYHRMIGNHVLMVSGSDQHGTPITVRAETEGVSPAEIAARYHQSFLECWDKLGFQWELFTRTTTENHYRVTQELFMKCYEKGYIYKNSMMMPFCPQEKRFLPDRYVEGICPYCKAPGARGDQCDNCGRTLNGLELLEPKCKFCGATPEPKETEHFFYKWSAFNEPLKEYVAGKSWWKPNVYAFTKRYLEDGLIDSAITRDIEWGVPVPIEGYDNKRIYVWFDAVIGYYSASIEWASLQGTPDAWKAWWEDPEAQGFYFIGKDNIPFHAVRWPAMLLGHGGLNLPYNIPANEYLTFQQDKFSTSKNRAVFVPDFLERYDPDPLRYFLSANMPEQSDTDFSWAEFVRRNNDELVAKYGNLVHRCLTFVHKHFGGQMPSDAADPNDADREIITRVSGAFDLVGAMLERCSFREAMRELMAICQDSNVYLDGQAPWKSVKTDRPRAAATMRTCLQIINALRLLFRPILPNTSRQLRSLLGLGDSSQERWAYQPLPDDLLLAPNPLPLFKKLDDSVVEEEMARMGGGGDSAHP